VLSLIPSPRRQVHKPVLHHPRQPFDIFTMKSLIVFVVLVALAVAQPDFACDWFKSSCCKEGQSCYNGGQCSWECNQAKYHYQCWTCPKIEDPEALAGWCVAVGKTLTGQSKVRIPNLTYAMKMCLRIAKVNKDDCGGLNYVPGKGNTTYAPGRTLVNSTAGTAWLPRWGKEQCADLCDTCIKEEEIEVDDGWCKYPGKYSGEYDKTSTYFFTSLTIAKEQCLAQRSTCSGITQEVKNRVRARFTLRKEKELKTSPSGEVTWQYCKPIESE